MPQQGINFAGSYIYLPGAYYADNVSAAAPVLPPATPPLLFVGYGWGPTPKVPVTFTNPQDLTNALRGSPAAAYVPFMATPSPALNGAQLITFIDASNNTQSTAALTASGGQTNTLLTSTLYGPPSNQLAFQVGSGSTAGRSLTIFDNFANIRLVGDNLTVPFTLAYSGGATGAVTYTVTSGSFTAFSPYDAESVVIPLGSGATSTVALLCEALNGTSNWFAVGLSSTGGQLPANFLTATASVSLPIPVSGALQYVNVNAYLQDMAFWVNQFASSLATAKVSGAALDTAAWLPPSGSVTYFSGAVGSPPVNSDYATALNVGLSTPAWTVFCDSNTTAVQALLAQHCQTASSVPYGSWRRGFTGSNTGDSISTAITNSRNLDTIQMNYLYPGIYRINTTTGQNQLYSGLYVAAMAASMATGNLIATPLTNKPLNATGVEQISGSVLTGSQLANLQNNGVMAVYTPRQTGIATILSDVTTWEDDNNVENTSSQQVACRYWLAYSVVNAVQTYVGSIAAPQTETVILNAVKRCLDALIYTGGSSNGVLTSWDRSTLILTYTGEQQLAAVSFACTLVGQNKFITVYASILPLNFTIVSTGA